MNQSAQQSEYEEAMASAGFASPYDWELDVYPDSRNRPIGIVMMALASWVLICIGVGIGWLIWG
jgi:hypothetical protein